MAGQINFNFCNLHNEEELDQFCRTCDKVLCNECIKGEHRDHDWCKLKKIAAEYRARACAKIREQLNKLQPKILQDLESVRDAKERNEASVEEKVSAINAREEEVVKLVRQIATKLRTACKGDTNGDVDRLESESTSKLADLTAISEHFKRSEKSASDVEIMQICEMIKFKCKGYISPDVSPLLSHSKFECGVLDPVFLKNMFGSIANEELLSEARQSFLRNMEAMELPVEGNFQFSPSNMISAVHGRMEFGAWVYSANGQAIQLVTPSGETLQSLSIENLAIRDFSLTSKGDLVLTDSINRELKLLKATDGSFKTVAYLSPFEPLGVTVDNHNRFLVGAIDRSPISFDRSSRRLVHRITSSGKIVQTIEFAVGETKWYRRSLFNRPWRIAENNNLDIGIIDSQSKTRGRLVVIDKKGGRKFTYEGQKLEKMFCPFDVTCDANSNFVLSDPRNNVLHVLDQNGAFIRFILTQTPSPHALSILNGELWVGFEEGKITSYLYKDVL